jgi:hypothetical protein
MEVMQVCEPLKPKVEVPALEKLKDGLLPLIDGEEGV